MVIGEATDERAPDDPVARALAGDEDAFEQLLLPLIGPAHRLAYALLRDRTAAEDAVQEACLFAWDRLRQLRSPESARSWFLAIVANRCRSATRRRWWAVLKRPDLAPSAEVPGPEAGVAVMALRDGLRRLSFNDRMVLYLRYGEDLSHEEIALAVGVRAGTVKSRIHRALHRLRGELSEEETR